MRRIAAATAGLAAGAAAAAVAACANIGSPPGGPLRTEPPVLIAVTPDSGAVNVSQENAVFEFDAVVNDRPSGQRDLESTFLISPAEEDEPRVSWHRERIEVRPRHGFRDSTAYSITMLPGIADLRGNVLRTPRTIVFSTGPVIPPFAIHGRIFDWLNERPATNGFVRAVLLPDSVVFVAIADSTGQFRVGPVPEGTYLVRGFMDANGNRLLDRQELWDTVAVAVRGTSPFVELLAAQRDTIGPGLLTVTVRDSLTLVASFDHPLDPNVPLTPASFRVVSADSSPLTVTRVRTRAEQATADSARADSVARRDSVARADSLARADTIARRDTAAAPSPVPVPARPAVPAPGVMPAIQPRPSRPAPTREVVITLDSLAPLKPGAQYRVTARSMRGLLGAVRTSDRVITAPRPQPPADSAAARPPADSASGRPVARP